METSVLEPGDPAYPSLLMEPASNEASGGRAAAPRLFVRGAIPRTKAVAIVGARKASEEARSFAWTLARELTAAGLCVWSGGAVGVDAAAHEGAMEEGGVTVVVMGGGLARPYPRENISLFDRALRSGGALVARVADDVQPNPAGFVQRNAVLAAATLATIIVEARLESGARSTAAAARRAGRPVLVVPHAPWDPRGAGCALELMRGARPITSADDVLTALGLHDPRVRAVDARDPRARIVDARDPRARDRSLTPAASHARDRSLTLTAPHARAEARTRRGSGPLVSSEHQVDRRAELSPVDPVERVVFSVLCDLPLHVDEVCEKASLPFQAAAGALLTLTLQAVVVEGPAGFYRRARR